MGTTAKLMAADRPEYQQPKAQKRVTAQMVQQSASYALAEDSGKHTKGKGHWNLKPNKNRQSAQRMAPEDLRVVVIDWLT